MTAKDSATKLAFLQKRIKGKSAVSLDDKQKPIPPRKTDEPIPLSFAQQRLWFLDQLEGGQASYYHVPSVWWLEGTLNVEAMERSLDEIVRRHDVLRTTFPMGEEGQPVQVIDPHVRVALPVTDLSSHPADEARSIADRLIQEEIWRSFDLTKEVPQRARLLRLSEQQHVLIWTVHHIVTDGWSLGVVNRELVLLYEAYCAGRPSPLAALPIQYADFSVWQRQWLQGEVLEQQLSYWRNQLGGHLPVLHLPTDRPRPSKQTFNGNFYSFVLSKSLSDDLRAFCQREGVTMFMTLMSVFKTLLGRYASTEDVIVGSTIAGRIRSELESLIGFFVNTLVLRTDLSGDPTFLELVQRARKVALEAYNHQDVPFEKLVEELQPERDMSQSPLFRVIFSHANASTAPLQLPGLTMTMMDFEVDTAKFELSLFFSDSSDVVEMWFEYNTDLFDHTTIERMGLQLQTMLETVMKNPYQRLSQISLLSDADRDQLLIDWNNTAGEYGAEWTMAEAFEQQAARTPDQIAVVYAESSLTYAELNARANQLASLLRKRGVIANDLVGVCMERSLDMIVSLLAILKAGAAYVPIDPNYPEKRLRFMLEDTGISVLLAQQHLTQNLPVQQLDVIYVEQEADALVQESTENVPVAITSDSLAYVMYTSGSTGRPKGVLVPQRGVLRLVNGQDFINMDENEVILQFAAFSFDVATLEIWGALLKGGRLVMMTAGKPTFEEIGEVIAKQGVTTLWLTAALFSQMVVGHLDALRPVRQLLFGGDVTPLVHVRKAYEHLPGCRLVNGYGPTENTTFTTCYVVEDIHKLGASVPIGRPIANTDVYILDETRRLAPIGVPGELCTGGAGLAYGYLNRPELTEEKFIPHPFSNDPAAKLYRTGDLARYLPDGNIEYLGRMDGQVKIRGYRIELGEIETVLGQHPSIREVVVIAREDEPGNKQLVAYVVPQQNTSLTPQLLREYLRGKLPDYMMPAAFVMLQSIPVTPNGKVDRRALPAPQAIQQTEEFVAPRNRFELEMSKVWEGVLKHSSIGVTDNFFTSGGDSLKAITLMSAIRKQFDLHLPLAMLFQTPTIAALCDHLATNDVEMGRAYGDCLVLIQQGQRGEGEAPQPPLFLIHPGWGGVLCYARLAGLLGEQETVYGVQAVGYETDEPALMSIFAMAERYVEEIVRVAPSGPYRLGGWSMGGIVAFEMARLLEQRGERVEVVTLIDSPFLGHVTEQAEDQLPLDADDPLAVLRAYASVQLPAVEESVWEGLSEKAIYEHLLEEGKAANLYPPGATSEHVQRDLKIFLAHGTATATYTCTEPIQADLHLLHVTEVDPAGLHRLVSADEWKPFTKGELTVATIPGHHLNCVNPPYVYELAEKMRRTLQSRVNLS